jgi:TRAP-type mannitol/chloroaromatic compound transport system permease large subunit
MKAMAPKEITLVDIYNSIIPFVTLMVIGLLLIMIFPQIALYLPQLYYGS